MKTFFSSKKFSVVKEYTLITIGLLIYVLAWNTFLIPNQLVGGGVTGIATLIFYSTGLPISITYFGINTVLILIGLKTIGWRFGVKTIYGVVFSSLAFQLIPGFLPEDLIQAMSLDNGKLISALIGAVISGTGVGIVIAQGGSTGGTDIVAQIVNKYRNISPGRIMLWCDLVIIGRHTFFRTSLPLVLTGGRTLWVPYYRLIELFSRPDPLGRKTLCSVFYFLGALCGNS
jgi:uncharacterized membrane-anchored protein YitT (DUF2179 family)